MKIKNDAEIITVDRNDLIGYYEDEDVQLHSFKKEVRSFFLKADIVLYKGRESYSKVLINRFTGVGEITDKAQAYKKEVLNWIELGDQLCELINTLVQFIDVADMSTSTRELVKDKIELIKKICNK